MNIKYFDSWRRKHVLEMSRIVIHEVMQWVENVATLVYKKAKSCISWQSLNNIFPWKEKKKSESNTYYVVIL